MTPALTNVPLRGGWQRVAVYDPATPGDLADVRLGSCERADPAPERSGQGDGTQGETRRGRALLIRAHGEAQVRTLDAWAAAGTDVRAVAIARGRGQHRVWRESVPCLLSVLPGERGGLGGRALRLSTALYSPSVYDSTDLLAEATFESGGDWTDEEAGTGTVTWGTDADGYADADLAGGDTSAGVSYTAVLPCPALPVRFAVDVTAVSGTLTLELDPLDSAGATLGATTDTATGTGTAAVSATLPAGTWSVVVRASVSAGDTATVRRPHLGTRNVNGTAL